MESDCKQLSSLALMVSSSLVKLLKFVRLVGTVLELFDILKKLLNWERSDARYF